MVVHPFQTSTTPRTLQNHMTHAECSVPTTRDATAEVHKCLLYRASVYGHGIKKVPIFGWTHKQQFSHLYFFNFRDCWISLIYSILYLRYMKIQRLIKYHNHIHIRIHMWSCKFGCSPDANKSVKVGIQRIHVIGDVPRTLEVLFGCLRCKNVEYAGAPWLSIHDLPESFRVRICTTSTLAPCM